MKWKYFSVLWQSLLPFQVGQEAMFCNSGTTLLYLVLHFFSPAHKLFFLETTIFPLNFFVIFFIWLSLQCSIEQACYTHLIYSWFEGHSISVLMILNHLVGNKICILCNFIPYSCARLHSGLLMISATALGHPLSFNFYPPSFLSLWMKMKKNSDLMITATALGQPLSFIFYPLSFHFIINTQEYTATSW